MLERLVRVLDIADGISEAAVEVRGDTPCPEVVREVFACARPLHEVPCRIEQSLDAPPRAAAAARAEGDVDGDGARNTRNVAAAQREEQRATLEQESEEVVRQA